MGGIGLIVIRPILRTLFCCLLWVPKLKQACLWDCEYNTRPSTTIYFLFKSSRIFVHEEILIIYWGCQFNFSKLTSWAFEVLQDKIYSFRFSFCCQYIACCLAVPIEIYVIHYILTDFKYENRNWVISLDIY